MADGTTTAPAAMPPPPTPEEANAAVLSVPQTRGEKIWRAIGSRAVGFGNGVGEINGAPRRSFEDTAVGKAMQQNYNVRLSEARRNWLDAQTKLQILNHAAENNGINPITNQPMTPDERDKLLHDANGAWGAYAKAAGVDKETKQHIAQKGQLFQLALTHGIKAAHEIAKKLGIAKDDQGQGGNGNGKAGLTPPPTPGPQQAPGATPPAAGAPSAAAAGNPAVPPPPTPKYDPSVNADAGVLRAEMADRHALAVKQAESDIEEKRQVAVEKAKTPASKATPASDAYFSLLEQIDPKTGQKYLPQDALKIVTEASTKAGRKTPFEEYMSDPEHYAAFEKEMAKAKQTPAKNASIGAVYGIYRMMEMGYKQNPDILPVVAQLAPEVFKSAGLDVPPAMAAALGKIPLDQPLSPVTGAPIGTSMPGAPTSGTRNQAQTAARALTELPGVRKEVDDLKGYLGPKEGRINVAFLLGKVGSTGDADKDQKLSKLRVDLKFMLSAAARFHLNSVRAFEDFEAAANAEKDSSAALLGALDSVGEWAKTAQKQETGAGEQGMTPPPSGGAKGDPLGIR